MRRWGLTVFILEALLAVNPCHGFLFRRETNDDPAAKEQQQQQDDASSLQQQQPTVTLSNGYVFPLVGVGVGNLAYDRIEPVLTEALSRDGYRLIDTNRASNNERMLADAIEKGMANLDPQDSGNIVNVVTKIWYTHLGYERTRLSVQESLEQLLLPSSKVDVRVHMLIHWPRCDDSIEWMNCEQEEEELDQHYKDAGPPPHLDKANAWKESWKALEDMYNDPNIPLASIGVSNFYMDDLQELVSVSRIKPHLLQGYVWTTVHDPHLMKFLYEEGILFQSYSIMNDVVVKGPQTAPNAYARLDHIGQHIMDDLEGDATFTAAQVVLAWFVQNEVSVIPRASSLDHQRENSPATIARVPHFSPQLSETIRQVVSAILRGQDMGSHAVQATFVNSNTEKSVNLFWVSRTGEEIQVASGLQPGQSIPQKTFPNHVFVAYDESKSIRKVFRITAGFGENQEFRVDLSPPKASFTANEPVHLFWTSHNGDEVPVKESLQPGDAFNTNTYPGHVFVAYDEAKTKRKEFRVSIDYGDHQHFHIEL